MKISLEKLYVDTKQRTFLRSRTSGRLCPVWSSSTALICGAESEDYAMNGVWYNACHGRLVCVYFCYLKYHLI